ncbi:unnamed protein product [Sphagnum compactum]
MRLFQQMKQEGMSPDKFTFVRVLNACANLPALEEGRSIHMQIIQSGCDSDIYVCNSLIDILVDMYAKCGSIEDALRVFKRMSTRNVVAWSAIILGHVKCGQGHKALELSSQMQQEGVEPNPVTFVRILNACASIEALKQGNDVHEQIIQSGRESNVSVGSRLVDMYAKCGSIDEAWRVFNSTPKLDDQEHPQINEIHAELTRLSVQMKDAGYVPDIRFMLHDVEEEEKLFHLCHHSEKLAIAYGLISTPPGTPIRVFKNLHVCGDCHSAAKFIAKLVGRAIIIRDANQFHHFENGLCSCKDYW